MKQLERRQERSGTVEELMGVEGWRRAPISPACPNW